MWTGINKRKFPRYAIAIELNVALDERVTYVAVQTENIGVGGLCFLFDRYIDPFRLISLRMPLEDGRVPIECNARVTWVVEKHAIDNSPTQFDIGVEFLGLNREDQLRITNLIDKKKGE